MSIKENFFEFSQISESILFRDGRNFSNLINDFFFERISKMVRTENGVIFGLQFLFDIELI